MQSGRTEQVISAAHSTPAHRLLLGLQLLASDRLADAFEMFDASKAQRTRNIVATGALRLAFDPRTIAAVTMTSASSTLAVLSNHGLASTESR